MFNYLKREGVIIMKNLLKNRKGFTLAEILLVVAIIAILSGATVIGVASWVNSSKQTAEQLTHNAADFEPGAYASVKAKKGTLPSYVEETETLNTGETGGEGQQDGQQGGQQEGQQGGQQEGQQEGQQGGQQGGQQEGQQGGQQGGQQEGQQGGQQGDQQEGQQGNDNNSETPSSQNGYTITGSQVSPTYDWWNDHGRARFNYSNLYTDQNSLTTAVVKAPSGTKFDSNKFNVTNNGDGTYTLKLKNGYFNPWDTNFDYSGTQLNNSNFALIGLS